MRYTNSMSTDITFQLDVQAADVILTEMSMPLVEQSANSIAARASSMASSISSNPPNFGVTTTIGVIRRGERAIASVVAIGNNAHSEYVGREALTKAIDAGRV